MRPPESEIPRSSPARFTPKRVWWPVAIALLVFLASSRSQVASPDLTEVDDKFAHFAVYGLLGTLACRVGSGWRWALMALVLVSAFGATDEWHQSHVPGRSPEIADWVADTAGAAVAILAYAGWGRYRKLLEHPIRLRPRLEDPSRPTNSER